VPFAPKCENIARRVVGDFFRIGIADHIVVSRKTLASGGVEWKARLSNESAVITLDKLNEILRPKVEIPDIVTS
jgi:hypothetical protein